MKTVHENKSALALRGIANRTRGRGHGSITRLMSPSDLGQIVKPFVFLDIFETKGVNIRALGNMPIHPHSGITTMTVFTKGSMLYNDPAAGSGALRYGAVEWARAGGGMWHGKELTADDVQHIQGFQLWIALPPDIENGEPVSRYIQPRFSIREF